MYKSLQDKLHTFHEVCNKPSEFRIAFAPFYNKDFYTLQKEIKKVLRSPYLVFSLDDEYLNDIYEFERNLPDEFAFRVSPKLKNLEGGGSFYETRYLYFITDIEKNRLEIYTVNNKREEVDLRFFEIEDKQLITSIEPQDYEIGKIRSVLTTFLAEELEYLTDTFALEANDELNYNPDYAKEGNELYQIIA
ncbi:hypothetical protein FXV77_20275 [Sphingobacterium phlebotomi]|uniref:Uncharacterized protein n=1 Tax=Sphingobacterium phlebotomi TaxID=2605433 RepID=A0A5D4GUT0_9SPHI|nr:hypothetical protein [Sphingobacterium phlebotomi]TYR31772.1 hypothetical protein FXV77_20275 [Sphingobacterium phlebotomi]